MEDPKKMALKVANSHYEINVFRASNGEHKAELKLAVERAKLTVSYLADYAQSEEDCNYWHSVNREVHLLIK